MKYRTLVFSLLLGISAIPAASAEMIEAMDPNKVFVLKHWDAAKPPVFVRTTDAERLNYMIDNEGYEMVAKMTESGPVPVTGDILPDELVSSESARAKELVEESALRERVSKRDPIDLGVGLNIGLTTGGKARLVATLGPGVVVGVDLDAGTAIFVWESTVSGILGWSFEAGRHVIRPYLTVGGGSGAIWALIAVVKTEVLKVGAGVEWKPAKWFGLGLEGGMTYHFYQLSGGQTGGGAIPFARLNVMFYFW